MDFDGHGLSCRVSNIEKPDRWFYLVNAWVNGCVNHDVRLLFMVTMIHAVHTHDMFPVRVHTLRTYEGTGIYCSCVPAEGRFPVLDMHRS